MEIFRFVFSPIDVNTYLIADETGECAVIDCGCYNREEFSRLRDFIDKRKLSPVLLLNTHCHLDHVFGNRFMLEDFGLSAYFHREDEENREKAVTHAIFFGLSMEPPPVPAGFLSDGEQVAFGKNVLTALHVPGHSKGSLAFYSERDSVVFTGDALFAGSIGRTDLPGGDYNTLIRSIRTKLFTLPGKTVVYPGHGESSSIRTEMTTNPYFIPG
jgi:hydroxyacylglutathione hydrolase